MKHLTFILIVMFFLFSCREKDLEKYKLVNNILNNPDNMVKIVKESKFYSLDKTLFVGIQPTVEHLIKYLKSKSKSKVEFNERYSKVYDSHLPTKYYFGHEIEIVFQDDCYDSKCKLYFYFDSYDNERWFLGSIQTFNARDSEY